MSKIQIIQPGDSEAEAKAKIDDLVSRAYALRFDPTITPPDDETCMVIDGIPIAARGNLTALQGKAKVGKSAIVSAILGAAQRGLDVSQGETIQIKWNGKSDSGVIIHLDTEQSPGDWHALVRRSVTRSGRASVSDRLLSIPLVQFYRSERMTILREILQRETIEKGSIDLVVIDGVADLCISPNDEGEALELISKIHALAQEFNCAIVCILHENPGTDSGKTRGHLGSELNRKAFGNLRIDKNNSTSISTLYGTDMRKRDIPKEHGYCFAWDVDLGMHTFVGMQKEIKSNEEQNKAINKKSTKKIKTENVLELVEHKPVTQQDLVARLNTIYKTAPRTAQDAIKQAEMEELIESFEVKNPKGGKAIKWLRVFDAQEQLATGN